MDHALRAMDKSGKTVDREEWTNRAQKCDDTGYVLTCKAIIRHTLLRGLEKEWKRNPKMVKKQWIQEAETLLASEAVGTARAIYEAAVEKMPEKKGLWRRYGELESKHGTPRQMESVLQRATSHCPHSEVLWLMRAKHNWLRGELDQARRILDKAGKFIEFSEQLALASAKLELESKQTGTARHILQRARKAVESPKVWQQSIQLEREDGNYSQAKSLCDQALAAHPKAAKLWMIAGQLIMEDPHQNATAAGAEKAMDLASRKFEDGLQQCPKSVPLWLCCVDTEIKRKRFPKARVLLEKARLKNPKSHLLWFKGVEVEEMDGNEKMASHTLHKGLQDCSSSGLLWGKAIQIEPKQSRQGKMVDGLKQCENDPYVQLTAAEFLWRDKNQIQKARNWLQRAHKLNEKLGDTYGLWMLFELTHGSLVEQRTVILKCIDAEPNQGLKWNAVVKRVQNWRLSFGERLREYLKDTFPQHWPPERLEPEIEMLLNGKSRADALLATTRKQEEDRQRHLAKDAKRQTFEEPFLASSVFTGHKPGYVFKLGLLGQGYYEDIGLAGRKKNNKASHSSHIG